MSETLFELREVSYAYPHGDAAALQAISLQVARGEHLALLGANGSGKSTLLRLMDALCFPTSGQIRAFGLALDEAGLSDDQTHFAFRRRVGLLFQDPDVQLFNPTVLDELAFGPLQLGWSMARVRQAVEEMLARMSLTPLANRSPHRLSGGEKKRVALASVLIMEPEVLLLDEPMAALDPASQDGLLCALQQAGRSGCTLITATHDLARAGELATRALVLAQGRLLASGPVQGIVADQALLCRARLIQPVRLQSAG